MKWLAGAVLLLAVGLAGCDDVEASPPDPPAPPGSSARRGVDVQVPNERFVPQAVTRGPRGSFFLGGYDWPAGRDVKRCQVAHVSRTGRVRHWLPQVRGRVPGRLTTYCRHGGGLAMTREGLMIGGGAALWLLDPDRIGRGDAVVRVWSLDGFRASTLAADGNQLVVGVFRPRGHGAVLRFDLDDVMAPGTSSLGVRDAAGVRRVPSLLQGLAVDRSGRLWLARSTTRCGELVTPAGRRLALVPGAEGMYFDGRGRLHVVSESGSQPYQDAGGRPDTPTVTVLDPDQPAAPCWSDH